MVDGASGSAGLRRAAAALGGLAREHPRSQLVLFNQGWVAAYRRDAKQALTSWGRTAMIDRGTPLGQAARQLVAALAKGGRRAPEAVLGSLGPVEHRLLRGFPPSLNPRLKPVDGSMITVREQDSFRETPNRAPGRRAVRERPWGTVVTATLPIDFNK